MRVMFFEAADDIGDIDRFETCCECGEVVYGGQMPRHFAKDHAREDEVALAAIDLSEGTLVPYESALWIESRTRNAGLSGMFAYPDSWHSEAVRSTWLRS